jgi:hypothetical protein
MKKIISTLTAVTFALGLAAAAQAQTVKVPEKPEVQPLQVAPKEVTKPVAPEAAKPVTPEVVKPGDKTKEAVKPMGQEKAQKTVKKESQKATKEIKAQEKTVIPPVAPQGVTK